MRFFRARKRHERGSRRRWLAVALAALLTTGLAGGALGATPGDGADEAVAVSADGEVDGGRLAPWRGSRLFVRNAVSAISLKKDAELTYDPYYAIEFGLSARWWFGRYVYTGIDFGFDVEVTDSNVTTEKHEVWLQDLVVRVGGSRFLTIPWVGIDFSADLSLLAPTSKLSQARSRYLGIRPAVTVSRTFDVLSGLTLSYTFQATKSLNEYTTSTLESPRVPGCAGDAAQCASFLSSGLRNPSWTLAHVFQVSMDFLDWLGLRGSVGIVQDFLYPMEERDERVSFSPIDGTDERFTMLYELELYTKPLPALGIALGARTINPQLAPNSTPETFFFNRYTTVYLDVSLDVAGLISQLTDGGL